MSKHITPKQAGEHITDQEIQLILTLPAITASMELVNNYGVTVSTHPTLPGVLTYTLPRHTFHWYRADRYLTLDNEQVA